MLRGILGVILGYVAMFAVIFVLCTGAYLAMGADRAFRPGTYDPSTLWLVVGTLASVAAAVVGGVVCRLIARSRAAVYALAGLVLILGLVGLAMVVSADQSQGNVRAGDTPNMEAMMKARQPVGVAIANPVIGVAGALVGGLLLVRPRDGRRRAV